MAQRGMQLKLIWITDDPREEHLEMLERLKMAGAKVQQVDPWAGEGEVPAAPRTAPDEDELFDL